MSSLVFRSALTAIALAFLVFSPAAHANDAPPIQDSIILELRAETWVNTARALVQVNVTAAGDAAKANAVRDDMLKALTALAPKDTEWRAVSLNRSTDDAGLDRWFAMFETRLPESALAGLADKAKQSSRAGLQMTVANVQFTPELSEIETARTKLRQDLYKQAAEELARVNGAMTGRNFRIAAINFTGGVMPMMQAPMMAKAMRGGAEMAMMAADSSVGSGGGMAVDTKMEQVATVILSAHAPEQGK